MVTDLGGSTLAQVMACCLTAPSHYLNQCCLFIWGVLWHSPESNFTRGAQAHNMSLQNTWLNVEPYVPGTNELTHWGRVTHICVSKLTVIGSDNGLSPDRRQAIIWTNAGLLLIEPLRTNFSEILIEILTFSFKKMHLKVSSAKWRPFCLCLNVLICWYTPNSLQHDQLEWKFMNFY